MSTEVEKEITVVIPSSKVADPEFIQQEVTKAKLRVLIEVHKGSDKSLYELIKEFLPDVIETKHCRVNLIFLLNQRQNSN